MKPNDILNKILVNCNLYIQTGVKAGKSTEDYKARIPLLCDNAQRELLEELKFTKTQTETLSKISGEGFRAVTLDVDVGRITGITDDDGRNWLNDETFAYQSGTDLYVKNDYTGDIDIKYIPNPDDITTLEGIFTLDDNIVKTAVIYYVSAQLLIDQNGNRAAYYQNKYNDMLRLFKGNKMAKNKKIRDVYK